MDIRILLEVLDAGKISTNMPDRQRGRYTGYRFRMVPIHIWRGCCMSSRP